MNLSDILNNTKKKKNKSFSSDYAINTPQKEYSNRETFHQSKQEGEPTPESTDEYENLDNFVMRVGECSAVEITNAVYDFDEENLTVDFTMDRLDNASSWSTGDIRVACWMSEVQYNSEDGWSSDNYCCIGDQFVGHLEPGYGFQDLKYSYDLPKDLLPLNCRWYFVFTINELSSDGNWYIIDFKNSSCNLPDEDYEKIVSIIEKQLGVDRSKITYEATIGNDLGADSLDAV